MSLQPVLRCAKALESPENEATLSIMDSWIVFAAIVGSFCAGMWIAGFAVRERLRLLEETVQKLTEHIQAATGQNSALRTAVHADCGDVATRSRANWDSPSLETERVSDTQPELAERSDYIPMKHLVVTAEGEKWVSERLPKDNYGNWSAAPSSVHSLISKPVGYRLVSGYHMLQEEDEADVREE